MRLSACPAPGALPIPGSYCATTCGSHHPYSHLPPTALATIDHQPNSRVLANLDLKMAKPLFTWALLTTLHVVITLDLVRPHIPE